MFGDYYKLKFFRAPSAVGLDLAAQSLRTWTVGLACFLVVFGLLLPISVPAVPIIVAVSISWAISFFADEAPRLTRVALLSLWTPAALAWLLFAGSSAYDEYELYAKYTFLDGEPRTEVFWRGCYVAAYGLAVSLVSAFQLYRIVQSNQSLQQTLDPAADPAVAESSSASSAAEPRR